jgi:carboxypeptidase Taq
MLDDYEPELTTKQITEVFERVKETLVPFLAKIREKRDTIDGSFLKDEVKGFDVKLQEQLSRRIAVDVAQYNLEQGRIDVSAHPFSIGIDPQDVRITTRYQNNEFLQGLAGTVHEAGHALYEMQLNMDYAGQPVQQPLSMGVHESQSLFWERHILLSKSFWQKHWSLVRETFPHIKEVTDDQVYKAANVVEFSNLIRVESDEVTYPLHIILRFEIERDLFSGAVQVDDLPKVWNEKMKQYLGIEPPTDAQGVLQDVHWSSGAFGYFPTYSLGAMYAAQIAAQPEIAKYVENGQYKEICQWLKEKIHTRGSVTLNANRLLKEATGEELNVDHFVKYLKDKYSEIYDL